MPNASGCGYKDDGAAGNHYAKLTAEKLAVNATAIAAFIAEPIVGYGVKFHWQRGI